MSDQPEKKDTLWTPGPWGANGYEGTEEDEGYFFLEGITGKDEGLTVAFPKDPVTGEMVFPNKADVALMVAAPDLYEALEALFAMDGHNVGTPMWDNPTVAKARAALAKARGEKP
jgi:hypothetical protein